MKLEKPQGVWVEPNAAHVGKTMLVKGRVKYIKGYTEHIGTVEVDPTTGMFYTETGHVMYIYELPELPLVLETGKWYHCIKTYPRAKVNVFIEGMWYRAVGESSLMDDFDDMQTLKPNQIREYFDPTAYDNRMGATAPETPEKVFNPQPHYDNTHGSLYKIAVQRGWNPYLFDIVKRLDRAGKKENNSIQQEIDKTIDVLKLWKTELYGDN